MSCSMDAGSDGDNYEYSQSEAASVQSMDGDYSFEADAQPLASQVPYRVYDTHLLRQRQQEAVDAVTSVLSIGEDDAHRLLRLTGWDINRANEEWFADQDRMRSRAGLADETPSTSQPVAGEQQTCMICFEEHPVRDMLAAPCAHRFCKPCWQGYVGAAISGGRNALNLRCPLPDCSVAVPIHIIRRSSGSEGGDKFGEYLLRSYVEDNRRMTWAMGQGIGDRSTGMCMTCESSADLQADCQHAVEVFSDPAGEAFDVHCRCGAAFCFTCNEEAHRPVDCDTVRRWLVKNSAESENTTWILANTKPCPKCKRPIEKNQGCMHMVCTQCRSEFCWLCLENWAEHGQGTGGYYSCNRFEETRKAGKLDKDARIRQNAKQVLERYMHYFERWAENDKAARAATNKMAEVSGRQFDMLSDLTGTPTSQLKFVLDAWARVIDCRRVLKWTYCYGYFVLEDPKTDTQKSFFEYNQEQAESRLEELHDHVERRVDAFTDQGVSAGEWAAFRERLIGMTDVVRGYFDKLVLELERGLDQLLSHYETDRAAAPPAPPQTTHTVPAVESHARSKRSADKQQPQQSQPAALQNGADGVLGLGRSK